MARFNTISKVVAVMIGASGLVPRVGTAQDTTCVTRPCELRLDTQRKNAFLGGAGHFRLVRPSGVSVASLGPNGTGAMRILWASDTARAYAQEYSRLAKASVWTEAAALPFVGVVAYSVATRRVDRTPLIASAVTAATLVNLSRWFASRARGALRNAVAEHQLGCRTGGEVCAP